MKKKFKKSIVVDEVGIIGSVIGWIGSHKIILLLLGGLVVAGAGIVKSITNYKTLKLAYENQEKKLKETEKKLKNTKVKKNVVKIIEKITMPDGTVKETEKIVDLTSTDTSTSTNTTTETESTVKMPSLAQQYGIGFSYQVTGYGSSTEFERLMIRGEYKLFDPLWIGASYQFPNKSWTGVMLRW